MKALIQRVSESSVSVGANVVGDIGRGLLVLLGIDKTDTELHGTDLAKKVLNYRIFPDSNDKMNLNIKEINGEILVISQFTLSANTDKGLRPSFSSAAPPKQAETLYELFVSQLKISGLKIQTGQFAADMKVSLTNDGPVTFLLNQ